MTKSLTNLTPLSPTLLYLIIFAILAALCGGPIVACAQESPKVRGQQRPRRVGATQTPTPEAAPQPSVSPNAAGVEVGENEVLRVDTQLVSVPAVVRDHTGHPLVSLHAENFAVFEDGRLQRITNFATAEAPFEVALLLDTSGSTRADVDLIRRAANAFIDSLRTDDRVALIAFNTAKDGASQLATVDVMTGLTSDRKTLRKALENIGSSNGTPYYDALERIADQVFRQPPREEVRGRRAVVALTDGVDSTSNAEYAEARAKLLRAGVACYFIEVNTEDFVEDRLIKDCLDDGTLSLSRTQLRRYHKLFVPRADAADYAEFCQLGQFERMQISRELYNLARREMNDLARASGGKTFVANDLRDARSALAQVATEIGTQYSLGYYPTDKSRDGRFRTIRVEVRGVAGGAEVRAREGYYAPKG